MDRRRKRRESNASGERAETHTRPRVVSPAQTRVTNTILYPETAERPQRDRT